MHEWASAAPTYSQKTYVGVYMIGIWNLFALPPKSRTLIGSVILRVLRYVQLPGWRRVRDFVAEGLSRMCSWPVRPSSTEVAATLYLSAAPKYVLDRVNLILADISVDRTDWTRTYDSQPLSPKTLRSSRVNAVPLSMHMSICMSRQFEEIYVLITYSISDHRAVKPVI